MFLNDCIILFKVMLTIGGFQEIKFCDTRHVFELVKRLKKKIAMISILFLGSFPKQFIVNTNKFLKRDLTSSTNYAF